MSRRPKKSVTAAGIAAVTVALIAGTLVGCGQMATAPPSDESALSARDVPSFDESVLVSPVDEEQGPTPPQTTPDVVIDVTEVLAPFTPGDRSGDELIVRTTDLEGTTGGMLSNGRWRIDVPANAVAGTARIVLATPSAKSWGCELTILPSDKNQFDVPVQLTVNCHSIPPHRLASYAILWYNPATKGWEPVAGSQVNLKRKTVSAPLSHFSIYAVGPNDGRGGW